MALEPRLRVLAHQGWLPVLVEEVAGLAASVAWVASLSRVEPDLEGVLVLERDC
jgi:hypothetical protein